MDRFTYVASFDLKLQVDGLLFIGKQLVAISNTGKVVVWQSVQKHWQHQEVEPLVCSDIHQTIPPEDVYSIPLIKPNEFFKGFKLLASPPETNQSFITVCGTTGPIFQYGTEQLE